jgi:hypothetical protein
METLGVISKVEKPTSWCSGMIVVPKKSGSSHFVFTKLVQIVDSGKSHSGDLTTLISSGDTDFTKCPLGLPVP